MFVAEVAKSPLSCCSAWRLGRGVASYRQFLAGAMVVGPGETKKKEPRKGHLLPPGHNPDNRASGDLRAPSYPPARSSKGKFGPKRSTSPLPDGRRWPFATQGVAPNVPFTSCR